MPSGELRLIFLIFNNLKDYPGAFLRASFAKILESMAAYRNCCGLFLNGFGAIISPGLNECFASSLRKLICWEAALSQKYHFLEG